MKFKSSIDETIFVSEIFPERSYMFDQDLKTGLSIIWNSGAPALFEVDGVERQLHENCLIFLTEYHTIGRFEFERLNVIQFNRLFYCVEEDDSEIGCKGLLFFGAAEVPKIIIPKERKKQFSLLWEIFMMEIEESDALKLEMLRALLKRFLILCLRVYKNQNYDLPSDNVNVGLIREYNYLVEQHFKMLTKVSDYARLLHKSPKTLANIFKKYAHITPLQVINERRLLEAKRLLKYSEQSIQEIAEMLNFPDVQSFSTFFRTRANLSPSQFRSNTTEGV